MQNDTILELDVFVSLWVSQLHYSQAISQALFPVSLCPVKTPLFKYCVIRCIQSFGARNFIIGQRFHIAEQLMSYSKAKKCVCYRFLSAVG